MKVGDDRVPAPAVVVVGSGFVVVSGSGFGFSVVFSGFFGSVFGCSEK